MAGGKLVYGTSVSAPFCAEVIGVNWSGLTRQAIDQTHTGTADNYMVFDPSKLVDGGQVEVELNFDADTEPPIEDAKAALTITFPPGAGQTTGASWSADAFLTEISVNGQDLAGKFTASTTWKISGKITFTGGS